MKRTIIAVATFALGCIYAQAREPHASLTDGYIEEIKLYAKMTDNYLASEKAAKNKLIPMVKKDIADQLKDPDSAKFRNVIIKKFDKGTIVCGEYNAKNSYGAYVGYRKFVAGVLAGSVLTKIEKDDPNEIEHNASINFACK